jgi:hypothetical protein
MKFKNNTKWNTKQLRRIIAAVVNRYLTKEQRQTLEVIANPVRAGTSVKIGIEPSRTYIAVPSDTTANEIRQRISPCIKGQISDGVPMHAESYDQYQTWSEKVAEMPLEMALVVKKKKDPLGEAQAGLKSSLASADEWKDKMLRAANKVQDYEKKAKYHTARIILLKKQRSGEVRKRQSPKAGDRDFRITRHRRGT